MLPDNKERISIQVEALNSCAIVLEYNFRETFISTIN